MFLEINQIRKSYGSGESRVEVLKGIDLYVEQGGILCASGAFRFRQIDTFEYYRRY